MNNLLFCLNATMPVFLLMVFGYILKSKNLISDDFAKSMNGFVFKIALPVLVFKELAVTPFAKIWNGKFVLFCFAVTILQIIISYFISLFFGKDIRAEFIQASFRSSSALLGVGIVENLYGNAGMVPLMIIGAVPLYNIMAVILLTCFKDDDKDKDVTTVKKTYYNALWGIIKNPIIIGIIIGFIWSLLSIPMGSIFLKTVTYVANLATPMGLIALGAGLKFSGISDKSVPVFVAISLKLLVFCAMFLPIAIFLGYANDGLIAILIMLGSPTTVSCYVMAKSMGHSGEISGEVVFFTTLLSSVTLTLWLFICKTYGLI